MSDKIIRRYPIRKTRKKWNIKLYSRHICSEFCDIKILRDARIPTQLFIMNNPFYKNGKCEKYNIISDTFIRLAYFNSENNHIDDSNELYDPNIKVIPDSCFKLSVYYPLTYLFEIIISSNTQDGYSLKDIIGYIKTLYEFIYDWFDLNNAVHDSISKQNADIDIFVAQKIMYHVKEFFYLTQRNNKTRKKISRITGNKYSRKSN